MIITEKQAKQHLRLIYYVIKCNRGRLGSYRIDEDEAFSRGLVGLAKAIKDYDEVTTPVEFFRFAYNHIWDSIFDSRRRHDIRTSLVKVKNAYYQKTGRHINAKQIATLLSTDARLPKLLRDHLRETMSYQYAEAYCGEDFGAHQEIYINKDDPPPEYAGSLETEFFNEAIMQVVNSLPELQRKIILLYFGLSGLEKCTMLDIYKILSPCTQHEIRESLAEALKELSQNKRLKELQLAEA